MIYRLLQLLWPMFLVSTAFVQLKIVISNMDSGSLSNFAARIPPPVLKCECFVDLMDFGTVLQGGQEWISTCVIDTLMNFSVSGSLINSFIM